MTINSGLTHESALGPGFISYTIPFLANIKFILDPSYDPVEDSNDTNPFLNGYRMSSYKYTIKKNIDNPIIEIVCIGKLPVFQEELLKLVKESKIADKYEMYPTKVVKYIMNCLKDLE